MNTTSSSHCSAAVLSECTPAHCRRQCALEVIDELLSRKSSVRGEEVDGLLDLRWHLRRAENAETALRAFCDLRVRMEREHYLAFFRIRRWLENNLVAVVHTHLAPAEEHTVPVKLNYYCVEAIRRATLCSALVKHRYSSMPKLQFAFRHPTGNHKTGSGVEAAVLI